MPISTIRAIVKKFKATGTVANLPGRAPMFIFPACTTRRKITEESSIKSPKLPLDMTSMPTKYLEVKPEKSLSCHFTKNISTWCSLNATGTLTGTVFYGQMKLKCSFLGSRHSWWVWHKKKENTKNNLHLSMVEFLVFSSKGFGNLRVHELHEMQYQEMFNLNLAAPARNLKLGRRKYERNGLRFLSILQPH